MNDLLNNKKIIIALCVFIPPLGLFLLWKRNILIWKKIIVTPFSIFFLLLIIVLFRDANMTDAEKEKRRLERIADSENDFDDKVNDYNNNLLLEVNKLNEERTKSRNKILEKLKKSNLYKELIGSLKKDQKYLSIFNAIGYGCLSSNAQSYELKLEYSENELDFIKASISTYHLGGIPKEIYQSFLHHKRVFGTGGTSGKYISLNDSSFTIQSDYDLSLLDVIFHPNSEDVLNSFYTNQKRNWDFNFKTDNRNLPQFSDWKAFNDYLGKVYSDSPHYKSYSSFVSASSLFSQYEKHEIKADSKYKGKKIATKGIIDDFGTFMGKPYLTLKTNALMFSVQCFFENNEEIMNLSKGESITIIGKCKGKLGNVMIKDCEIW